MKPKIYIETSIPSYLTARRSRDLIVAAHQTLTQEWWDNGKQNFDLYVSELVLREISAGDPDAARSRLAIVTGISELNISQQVEIVAQLLLDKAAVPMTEKSDALHIAIAAVYSIDYLLTWNCKHIANPKQRPIINAVCRSAGCNSPLICTPLELIGV